MQIDGTEVIARPMVDTDRNFVLATWLRSAKDLTRMGKSAFFDFARPQVLADIDNGVVVVACDSEVPGSILGWVCYRDNVVRWAYTVYPLRNLGIFNFLKEQYVKARQEAEAEFVA